MNIALALAEFLKSQGADLVSFADLTLIPAEVRLYMPTGVSIAVALNPDIVKQIENGPTMQYYEEYMRLNDLLSALSVQGARFLKDRGFQAISSAATNEGIDPETESTLLPHKTVATLAGLGWIGKCALLITEGYGSAVRINKILTDAPLPNGQPSSESRCGACNICVDVCPGHAPSGKEWSRAGRRDDFFNAFACRQAAQKLAIERTGIAETFCGICIAVCPWTRNYVKKST